MSLSRHWLLSLHLSTGKYADFVCEMVRLAQSGMPSYVCIANVHMCIEAWDDPQFAEMVNSADIVTPDGMPLVVASRFLQGVHTDRADGMNLLPDLINEAASKQIGVFFYGGSPETLAFARQYIHQKYPLLNANYYSPPYRTLSETEKADVIQQIRASGAGMIFVALGCPKQERWMAAHGSMFNACMFGIGGALPVMLGIQKRAPEWMRKASLEWLFRLAQEPTRLFKRYFYTNLKFLGLIFIALIRKSMKRN